MSAKLLPCPFCGNAPIEVESFLLYSIGCDDCGVSIDNVKSKRPHIIAAWNCRAHSPQLAALEKVAEAADRIVDKHPDEWGDSPLADALKEYYAALTQPAPEKP